MNWNNELTRLLAIAYPVIQAPMLGVTTPGMVAAAARCGTLGSLPVGGLSPQMTAELIRQTKRLTDKPFAVNLFVYDIPESTEEPVVKAMQERLRALAASGNLDYEEQSFSSFVHYSYREQVQVLLDENIKLVSFTFGLMEEDIVKTMKDRGILLMGTATSVREAVLLEERGTDIIAAQGIEAGGHRGSFLDKDRLPMVGAMSLIPQVVDSVACPVVAAGGIRDGRTVKAAMILGALGVQVGTALLASEESKAAPAYKAALQEAHDTDTRLTRSFSGRWARGIANTFMEQIDHSGLTIPEYPFQNSLTTALRAAAFKEDNKELINLWAGQSAGGAAQKSTAAILERIIEETERLP